MSKEDMAMFHDDSDVVSDIAVDRMDSSPLGVVEYREVSAERDFQSSWFGPQGEYEDYVEYGGAAAADPTSSHLMQDNQDTRLNLYEGPLSSIPHTRDTTSQDPREYTQPVLAAIFTASLPSTLLHTTRSMALETNLSKTDHMFCSTVP